MCKANIGAGISMFIIIIIFIFIIIIIKLDELSGYKRSTAAMNQVEGRTLCKRESELNTWIQN
jgi:uncharacterized protein YpmB